MINLPRHLRSKEHNWSNESAVAVTGQFAIRRKMTKETSDVAAADSAATKHKSYHRKRICPVSNCMKVVLHLNEHLQKTHKMERNQVYRDLLRKAHYYCPGKMPKNIVTSPRKRYGLIKRKTTVLPQEAPSNIMLSNPVEKEFGQNLYNDNEIMQNVLSPVKKFDLRHLPTTLAKYSDSESDSDNNGNNSSSTDSEYENDVFDENGAIKCGPYVSELLTRFYKYMIGPDRGRKRKPVSTVVYSLKKIFSAIGVGNSMTVLFDDIRKSVRDRYLMQYCVDNQVKPGSIRTYLYALKDFCQFLLAEDITVDGVETHQIRNASHKLEQWRRNYRSKDKLRKHVRAAEDLEMIVTPDQVSTYEKSENAILAKVLFREFEDSSSRKLSLADYCCVRDHLYTILLFANGHRSGVIANMTMEEFGKAKVVGDVVEINVWRHKTVDTYGPAKVTLLPQHFSWLNIYVLYLRSQLTVQCSNVFLSWTGNAISPGDVSKRLHLLWTRAGIFDGRIIPKNLSVNIVRKSASTGLRENNSEHVKAAADSMMHSKKTADEHYALINMQTSVAEGSKALRSHFYRDVSESPKKENLPLKWEWKVHTLQRHFHLHQRKRFGLPLKLKN